MIRKFVSWFAVIAVASLAIVGLCASADFGPNEYKKFDIVNNLNEPVRINVTTVNQDETLPFDLNRTLGRTAWGWPNKVPGLEPVGETIKDTGTLIPGENRPQLYDRKVLVSAWADEGRVLFQAFIEWDQLFIGSDEIYTLVMTPQ